MLTGNPHLDYLECMRLAEHEDAFAMQRIAEGNFELAEAAFKRSEGFLVFAARYKARLEQEG